MKIAVAMSGGVDSLCAVLLLRKAGCNVFGLHARLADPGKDARGGLEAGLRDLCDALSIQLHVVDLGEQFAREIIQPFEQEYCLGRTPNPCALCNRKIKFSLLQDLAFELGADKLATGHYARFGWEGARQRLGLANDPKKDQSYFMALVEPERLVDTVLPMSAMNKEQCRRFVRQSGFEPPAPAESQDICFLQNNNYRDFLDSRSRARPGQIFLRDENGERLLGGQHRGLRNYTLGQRKGLGMAYAEPLYVLEKDLARNALVLGSRSMLGMTGCSARMLALHLAPGSWPEKPLVKLRSTQQPVQACVRFSGDVVSVEFASAQFPASPGQIAAFYDNRGWLLGGGIVQDIQSVR